MESCHCDIEDEAIICHNFKNREKFNLPKNRFRNFKVIGLRNNNIKNLPNENDLLEKFPDLKVYYFF